MPLIHAPRSSSLRQRVFDKFDALADIYGVQKVRKTANEQSIFAAGLPDGTLLPSPSLRACGLAAFGFALIAVMEKLNVELRMWGIPLKLQVGIHSGAVIAGVIGHKTVQWDLCGDAVNTAARMCTYSKPGHVHVSEATCELTPTRPTLTPPPRAHARASMCARPSRTT